MNKVTLFLLVLILLSFSITKSTYAEIYGGVEFPAGAVSFADSVVSYAPGGGVGPPYNNPSTALGIPDYIEAEGDKYAVSLGDEGVLVLQFTDNSLTISGDDSNDLWVFEAGGAIEPTAVAISINGNDWIEVGSTSGSTSGIDIDAYIGSGVIPGEKYNFIRITDLLPSQGSYPYKGADIDAVGVISSSEPAMLVANAGPDQIVYDLITLDGSNSYAQNCTIVSYQWQITHKDNPIFNRIVEGEIATVTSLEKGFYEATLTITNNLGDQEMDTMFFSATGEACKPKVVVIPLFE